METMKISLTKIDSYDLDINGVAFKNMRVTGKLEGIMALSNGTNTATLFHDGKDGVWLPIRYASDIQKAMALKGVHDLPQQPPTPKDEPLVWPDLICEHDWVATMESTHRTCVYCKKSEEMTA